MPEQFEVIRHKFEVFGYCKDCRVQLGNLPGEPGSTTGGDGKEGPALHVKKNALGTATTRESVAGKSQ